MKQTYAGGVALLACLVVVAVIVLGANTPRSADPSPEDDSGPALVD
ncbi:hypothetical protein [Methanoculleus sp.]